MIFDEVLEKYPEEPLSYYDYIYAYTNGLRHSDFTLAHINEINELYAKMQSIIAFSKKDPVEQHKKLERFIKDFEKELEAQRQRELLEEQERQRQYIKAQHERLADLLEAKRLYVNRPLKFSVLFLFSFIIILVLMCINDAFCRYLYVDTNLYIAIFLLLGLSIGCLVLPLIRRKHFLGNDEIYEIERFLNSVK